MKRLDRALLAEAALSTGVVLLALAGLALAVDLFERVGDLLERPSPLETALRYLWLRLPLVGADAAPFAVVLGTLVALARWARGGELAAAAGSGISPRRLSLSLIGFSVLCSAAFSLATETWVPRAARTLSGEWEALVGFHGEESFFAPGLACDDIAHGGEGRILQCRQVVLRPEGLLEEPCVYRPSTGELWRAERARWVPDGWLLEGGWRFDTRRSGAAPEPIPPAGLLWRTGLDTGRILERPLPARALRLRDLDARSREGGAAEAVAYAARWAGAWWIVAVVAASLPAVASCAFGARKGALWAAVGWGLGLSCAYQAIGILAHGLGSQGVVPPALAVAAPLAAAWGLGITRIVRWRG